MMLWILAILGSALAQEPPPTLAATWALYQEEGGAAAVGRLAPLLDPARGDDPWFILGVLAGREIPEAQAAFEAAPAGPGRAIAEAAALIQQHNRDEAAAPVEDITAALERARAQDDSAVARAAAAQLAVRNSQIDAVGPLLATIDLEDAAHPVAAELAWEARQGWWIQVGRELLRVAPEDHTFATAPVPFPLDATGWASLDSALTDLTTRSLPREELVAVYGLYSAWFIGRGEPCGDAKARFAQAVVARTDPSTHAQLADLHVALDDLAVCPDVSLTPERAQQYADLGQLWLAQGNMLGVYASASVMADFYQRHEVLDEEATLRLMVGHGYVTFGLPHLARAPLERAVALEPQLSLDDAALAWSALASTRQQLGDIPGALEAVDAAAQRFEALGDAERVAETWLLRGVVLADAGRFAEAEAALDRAEAGLTDPEARVDLDLQRASVDHLAGQPRRAVRGYDRALRAMDEGHPLRGKALLGRCGALYDLGEADAALASCEAAFAAMLAAGDVRGQGLALMQAARDAQTRGQDGEAGRMAGEALDIALHLGDPYGEVSARLVLSMVALRSGDARGAADHAERALAIAEQMDDAGLVAEALVARGQVLYNDARFPQALGVFTEAEARAQASGDLEQALSARFHQAMCWERLGDPARAVALLEEAADGFGAIEARAQEAQARLVLAQVRMDHALHPEERQQGLDELVGLLDVFAAQRNLVSQLGVVLLLAEAVLEAGDPARAEEGFELAAEGFAELGDTPNLARALRGLAQARSVERYDARAWGRALEAAEAADLPLVGVTTTLAWLEDAPDGVLDTPEGRARVATLPDLLDAAARSQVGADARLELINARHRDAILRGAMALLLDEQLEPAFRLLTSAQGAGLRAERRLRAQVGEVEALTEARLGLVPTREALLIAGQAPEAAVRAWRAALLQAAGALPGDAAGVAPTTDVIADLQARGAVLVAFYLDGHDLLRLVMRPDGWQATHVAGAAPALLEDARAVAEAMDELAALPAAQRAMAQAYFPDDALRRLGAALLDPVLAEVPPETLLLIAADGPLQGVPFSALVVEGDQPLVVRHPVALLPAADWLAMTPVSSGSATGALLIDATAVPGQRPLPLGQAELDAVAGHLGEGVTRACAGCALAPSPQTWATLAPDAAVVHVVAHGVGRGHPWLDLWSAGSLSHLWLMDEAGAPVRLWEDHLLATPLRAELVVLSACQTTTGRTWPLEGTQGLARAALAAGAQSVVSTLWTVDDGATGALMDTFYEGYVETGDKARALRAAQLQVRAAPETAHPFYWAGVTLWGDPG
ncbi:MAG: CHAT domain-containing protein [Alphaproteobacteria bacterium]|nr:CHAT domain-containing protein [Alphaproteobacteria bacterium]